MKAKIFKNKIQYRYMDLKNLMSSLDSDGDVCGIFKIVDPEKINNQKTKKVSFGYVAKVVLIPKREEYYNAGIDDYLWWKESDIRKFEKLFSLELNVISKLNHMVLNDLNDLIKVKKIWYNSLGLERLTKV